jgi:quinol monooxygenase YgiN
MIIVIGAARAHASRRDQLLTALHDIVRDTNADDGCISYRFAADIADPDVIVGIEVWRDQAALDAHMQHGHTAAFLAVIPELIDGEPELTIHQVAVPA